MKSCCTKSLTDNLVLNAHVPGCPATEATRQVVHLLRRHFARVVRIRDGNTGRPGGQRVTATGAIEAICTSAIRATQDEQLEFQAKCLSVKLGSSSIPVVFSLLFADPQLTNQTPNNTRPLSIIPARSQLLVLGVARCRKNLVVWQNTIRSRQKQRHTTQSGNRQNTQELHLFFFSLASAEGMFSKQFGQ